MIRLHHVPQSRSFRILWLMEELGLHFEMVEHRFFDKSLRGADYLAISPAGRVPALEIDGRALFESGAITQYLCETRGLLQGARVERPDWLEWLHYAETIAAHVANLTQQHVVLREDWMRSATVMRLEAARLLKTLEVVERGLSADYILPSGFSAVDVAVSYGALIGARFVRLDGLARVQAWLARLAERPAFGRAVARDGVSQIYAREFYPAPEASHG